MATRPGFPARLPGSPGHPPATKKIAGQAQRERSAGQNTSEDTQPRGYGLDSGAVRARMVQKLAAQGISDAQVLAAMGHVERHRFVDSALVNQAYEDTSLPIGLGQTISKPNVVARMLELLLGGQRGATGRLGRVLEIGTGCGYQAAVLSLVATEVYSIERLRGLHDRARENLRHFRLANVHLLFGDGMAGYAKGAPYAGIIAAAGGDAVPPAWVEQLAVGGRIVAPTVMADGKQALVVLEKTTRELKQTVLEAVHFVPLKSGIA
ncbi:MAG: protein-L-isoaspartate(D-aspartate) O-methyltransferase [Burkholderiales bacterium]|nr:protein-L-isoaspartate(D-aspartate) O-methyltransferase [Burkholderiales bacterium]